LDIELIQSNIWAIISIVVSIAALIISIRVYRINKYYNVYRPHSERLANEFSNWVKNLVYRLSVQYPIGEGIEKSIKQMQNELKVISKENPEEKIFSNLQFYAKEHLRTGYKNLYRNLVSLADKIKKYDEEAGKKILEMCENLMTKTGLHDWVNQTDVAYYSRIVSYVIKNRFTGSPIGNPLPELVQEGSRTVVELRWEGTLLARGSNVNIGRLAEAIDRFMTNEVKELERLHQTYLSIKNEFNTIIEELNKYLIDFPRGLSPSFYSFLIFKAWF